MGTMAIPGGLRWLFSVTLVSEDEKEARAAAKREAKFKRLLQREQKREVRYLSKAIPVWLAKMGHAYWYRKSEKDLIKGQFNPVKIKKCLIGEDAYWLQIDTRRLPRGVFIANLRDDSTLETLTAACGSAVTFESNSQGYWYVVETKYGRGNIPTLVGYAEMLKIMPPDAGPMVFPLGMGENQRPMFCDLNKIYTLQIGGAKGTGKSTLLNNMICTLLTRNTPFTLRLFLTDLKGGIEFYDYGGVPHLGGDVYWSELPESSEKKLVYKTYPKDYRPKPKEKLKAPAGDEIYTDPGGVLPMLAYCEAEMDRRARLIAPTRAKNIKTYNKKYPDKSLSYWLIVIDELATLMEDRRFAKLAEASLSELARKGRAVGIYLILATQTPTSKVVPSQVAGNMDARVAFRTGSGPASGVLLGDGQYDAVRLPPIEGRFIWKWGTDRMQLQGPLISESAMAHIVADVKAGKYVDAREAELAQKADHLFRVAIQFRDGRCQTNDIYGLVKTDGLKKAEVIRILDQYQVDEKLEPEIRIDDQLYYLAPAIIPKKIARWLVPVADFLAQKHPDPNYDFSLLAFRIPHSENPEITVSAEISKSDGYMPNGDIDDPAKSLDASQEPSDTNLSDDDRGRISPDLAIAPGDTTANGDTAPPLVDTPEPDIPDWLKNI